MKTRPEQRRHAGWGWAGERRWATPPRAGSSGGDGWTPPLICRSVVPPGLGCGKGTRPSNELLGYFRVVPTARNPVGWSAAARGYRARTSSLPRFPLAARGCTKRVKYKRGKEKKTIEVIVPKLITTGQKIKLTGMGEPGMKPGDLYLHIKVK